MPPQQQYVLHLSRPSGHEYHEPAHPGHEQPQHHLWGDLTAQCWVTLGAQNFPCSANRFRCKLIGTTRPAHIWEDSISTAIVWSTAKFFALPTIMFFMPLYFTAKHREKKD